jgi:hypothetical protein
MVDVSEGSLGMSGGHRLPERRSLYNSWMTQIARNITDAGDGFLRGTRSRSVLATIVKSAIIKS